MNPQRNRNLGIEERQLKLSIQCYKSSYHLNDKELFHLKLFGIGEEGGDEALPP